MFRRLCTTAALPIALCALGASDGFARQSPSLADYPVKTIRIVVASSPGTASDFFARSLGEELGAFYQQRVVIDNRAGAGGLIGNSQLSSANGDGYTLGMVDVTRIITELMHDQPPYQRARRHRRRHARRVDHQRAGGDECDSRAHGVRIRRQRARTRRRVQLRFARHRLGVASRRRSLHARARHPRGARAVPESLRLHRRDGARARALRAFTRCRRCWGRCATGASARSP